MRDVGLHVNLQRLRSLVVVPWPKYHVLQKLGRVAEMHQWIRSTAAGEELLAPERIRLAVIRVVWFVRRIRSIHIVDKRIRDIRRRKGNVVLRCAADQELVVVGRQ